MQGTSPHNPSPCEHLPAGAFCVRCGYFASGLGNGVVNMIGSALRQMVVLVPCLWLLIRTMGIEKAWFAFWVSEVIACAYSLWATKKELRNKVKESHR
jgi:Na+-driven multidrug efflux pump